MLDVDLDEDPAKDGRRSLDELESKYGALPHTVRATTGGGGLHIYFRHDGNGKIPNSTSTVAPGLDVRGDGGYVLVTPSETTGPYCYLPGHRPDDTPLADAPDWLFERVREKPKKVIPAAAKARGPVVGGHPYVRAVLDGELGELAQTAKGQRNDRLNVAAFNIARYLVSGGLDEHDVEQLLEDAAARCGEVADKGVASVQRTIRSGLEAGKAQPREIPSGHIQPVTPQLRPPSHVDPETGEVPAEHQVDVASIGSNSNGNGHIITRPVTVEYRDGLPAIVVTNRPLREITRDALSALREANAPPAVFVRSGELVSVQIDEKQRPVIRPLVEAALRGKLERSANYLVLTKRDGLVHTPPPIDVVRDLSCLHAEWKLPALEGIVEAPVLRPDGSVLDTPGYDGTSRLVYKPAVGLRLPSIPKSPSADDVTRALEVINEAIGDFPFASPAAYANTLALLLTPIVRQTTAGPVPMALIDAPLAGTGKGLLGEVVALIATGRPAGTTPDAKDDEEWRKRITSLLRDGTTVITIDNILHRLDAAALSSVLTARVWRERVLGQTATQEWPQRATWIATGNNLQLGGDMPRRCYWIRLDSRLEQPWRRATEDFHHYPLLPWVEEHRGELLAALLTLARAWYAAGQPQPESRPSLGSFESWASTIGGILAHAGVEDFLANLDDLYERNNDERSEWLAFLLAWHARYGNTPTLLATVATDVLGEHPPCKSLREALPGTLADAATSQTSSFTRRLGRALGQHVEQPFGNLRILRAGHDGTTKVLRWKVDETPGLSISNRGFRGFTTPVTPSETKPSRMRVHACACAGTDACTHACARTRADLGPKQTPETPETPEAEIETASMARGFDDERNDLACVACGNPSGGARGQLFNVNGFLLHGECTLPVGTRP